MEVCVNESAGVCLVVGYLTKCGDEGVGEKNTERVRLSRQTVMMCLAGKKMLESMGLNGVRSGQTDRTVKFPDRYLGRGHSTVHHKWLILHLSVLWTDA